MAEAKQKKGEMNMLRGSLWDKIILFAIPMALTGVLQQLYNAADVAVLGQFVGKNAMAAVGNNISLIGLLVNLFLGLSLGANVVIAQNVGGRRFDRVKNTVHTAFLMALFVGAGIAVLGEILAGPVMEFMEVPAEVRDMAETYFRVYLLGMPFLGLYNFESAIFRSRGDTRTPLLALIVSSSFNVVMDLVLVLVFGLGVAGVAIATALANVVSSGILLYFLHRTDSFIHVDLHALSIDKARMKEIVKIGLPAGIQGMVFSVSNLLIQSAINGFGPDTMAASAAAFTIEINVYCVIGAFSQATTTFTGQNYGAGKLKRCRRVFWVAMGLNALFMGILSAISLIFGKTLLAFFNPDPNVVEIGYLRMLYIIAPEMINVVLEGCTGALRGYGISMAPAALALFGICGVRIVWLYTIFVSSHTFETLMMAYPVSWVITTALTAGAYVFYINHLKPVPAWKQTEES